MLPGFLPGLAPILGPHSFDAGNEETRFSHFAGTGLPMAVAFVRAWVVLQQEVGVGTEGPLSELYLQVICG